MGTQRERIKIIRKKERCTAASFASAIQDKVDSVRNTESGKKKVTGDMLQSIVSVFSVNAHWLLTGEGEMYQSRNQDKSPVFPTPIPASTQKKLINNHRRTRIQTFINYWFKEESPDDQAWLEMQLSRSIPEYKSFISNQEIEKKTG